MIHEGNEFDRHVNLNADVVVVGSGAGGPVVAKELQERGLSVILLEEGGHIRTEDFKPDPVHAFRTMYRDNGATGSVGLPPIPFPIGRCLGGTTTVNSGTCFRTPDKILRQWELKWNMPDISPDYMRPYFERVEDFYSVREVHAGNMGRNGELILRGARELGYSCGPLKRNMNENCTGCGICTLGCPAEGKQPTLFNYIPAASEMGAEVYCDFRVEKILVSGGVARGVAGSVLHRNSSRRKTTFSVSAKVTALAAGAVHTPHLLQKNKLCNSSGQLGKNLRIHPGVRISALMDEEVNGWLGVPQGTYVDEFWDEGIMLEGVFVGPMLAAPALPYHGSKAKELMYDFPKISMYGAMVHDETRGTVRPGFFNKPLVIYQLIGEDLRKAVKGIAYTASIYFAAGAKRVFTNVPWIPELKSPSDISELLTRNIKKTDIEMMAFHPMGSCRMGSSREKSVVGPYCETFDVENLFVTDASIFPSCLGVNPMESIMAFANRSADHIRETKF